MASKTIRFEVFKRDGFQCLYCGRKPPEVTLELDHIYPKSKGGINDVNNYATACRECNIGKTNKLLTDIPNSMETNLNNLKEKQLQLEEYHKYVQQIEHKKNRVLNEIEKILIESSGSKYCFADDFKNVTVRDFINKLPPIKVKEALRMACSKVPLNNNRALKYFCGICWNWIKKPESRDW
jgi:hypothetical protein